MAKHFVPRTQSALFGGSFDPVHRGHLEMVQKVREVAGLDRVVFVPAAVSPFKDGTLATGEQRREMLEIALADAGMEWAEVSDYELQRPAPSYSWQTARFFSERFPDQEWSWILGADQWEQIEKWAEPEYLRKTLRFVVLRRGGQPIRHRPDWRQEEIDFHHPASSTEIRRDFRAHKDWLTPRLVAYCEERGLYGSTGTSGPSPQRRRGAERK